MMDKANDVQVGGSHYCNGNPIQHWDFTWEHNYNQFEYCVSKYVSRCWAKNGKQDLEKAKHHLQKYIELTGSQLDFSFRVPSQSSTWCEASGLDVFQAKVINLVHLGLLEEAFSALTSFLETYIDSGEPSPAYVDQG